MDPQGTMGLLFAGYVTGLVAWWKPSFALPLLVGYALRAVAALVHFYIFPLPDGLADAVTFERVGAEWAHDPARLGFLEEPYSAYLISWIYAQLYAVFGRSPLLAQSVSVLFGTLTIVVVAQLGRELWSESAGRIAAWMAAIFPNFIQYSALTMREALIWFFVLCGFLYFARFLRNGRGLDFGHTLAGFAAASAFHGGIGMLLLGSAITAALASVSKIGSSQLRYLLLVPSVMVTGLVLWYAWYIGAVSFSYIGTAGRTFDPETLLALSEYGQRGGSAFPDIAIPHSVAEIFWKAPFRLLYFMFAPFPWDIRSTLHLVGLLDGVWYWVFGWLIASNLSSMLQRRDRFWVLVLLCFGIAVFAMGTANIGTGIRHRAKFAGVLIALVAGPLAARFGRRTVGRRSFSDLPVMRGTR